MLPGINTGCPKARTSGGNAEWSCRESARRTLAVDQHLLAHRTHPSQVLNVSDVSGLAIAKTDCPLGSIRQYPIEIRPSHLKESAATGTARDVPEKLVQ